MSSCQQHNVQLVQQLFRTKLSTNPPLASSLPPATYMVHQLYADTHGGHIPPQPEQLPAIHTLLDAMWCHSNTTNFSCNT